jgi:hypothetical protein
MRLEICDIPLHAPSPKITSLLGENASLKTKNNNLIWIAVGAFIVGTIGLGVYLHTKDQIKKKKLIRPNVQNRE